MNLIFLCVCSDLGLSDIDIITFFRLGRKDKTRTLKIVQAEKYQRNFRSDNARFIPTKVNSNYKDVVISKELTPQQRVERRQLNINKKGSSSSARIMVQAL